MKRSSIAIDLDDVLAAHVEAFVAFSNQHYGTHLTVEEYDDHWGRLWDVELEEIERRANQFHIPENIAAYQVKEEATAAIRELGGAHDLFIVTARRKWVVEATKEWVATHFPHTFKSVHFVPIWEPDNKVTKADICRQIGADYLIDDLSRHCNIAAEAGIKAVLFGDYVWNRNEEIVEGVTRCANWPEVLAYFERK